MNFNKVFIVLYRDLILKVFFICIWYIIVLNEKNLFNDKFKIKIVMLFDFEFKIIFFRFVFKYRI